MGLDVIDAHERQTRCHGIRLRGRHPDNERSDQPRPMRHGDRGKLVPSNARVLEGLLDDKRHQLDMLA